MATYYEPFVGGGAVFFSLAAQGRFQRAVLSDRNEDLVLVYQVIKDDVEALIRSLKKHRHDREEYYRVRAQVPTLPIKRAARVIYLNKTGFNGLYRVNRSGQFNVPFGSYTNPTICDERNLRAAAVALAKARVVCRDFEATTRKAKPGDVVYFDPPYVPVSTTSSFAEYDRHPFTLDEQRRLVREFKRLAALGVYALLSNSDTPETRELYAGLHVECVEAKRPINSNPRRRGPIPELLVSNLPLP